jgi:radical SAM protein with 4Fe4S-binding SPASM domain
MTFKEGAERFYSYVVDDLGITDFQINTPFPGGQINNAKKSLPLDTEQLARFLCELADVWMDRGYNQNIRVGPFDQLIEYFLMGDPALPCIWGDNCAKEFVCIDPEGYVSQCDCWASSYPRFRFGNIFESNSLSELLQNSEARQRFLSRPAFLVEQEECIECDYLALCHGGCPIRSYAVHGSLMKKDPYCTTYKAIFRYMEETASKIAENRAARIEG